MNKALIIIDYQNDLLDPKGKVAQRIKGGNDRLLKAQAISSKIQELINKFSENNQKIVSVQSDYALSNYTGYYKEKRAEKLYADTAVAGTWGHELYKLQLPEDAPIVVKHYFDGFYETNLHEVLEKLQIDELYICGVNTDVCVVHTAIGAAWRGYKTHVIEDLTETISPHKEQAIEYLASIVDVDSVNSADII